jgi:putative transposase
MKNGKIISYQTKNPSKFLLSYHIIFVCKYRKKLLDIIGERVKNIMNDIADRSDFEIVNMEVDRDHIHFLIRSEPKLSPLMIVRQLKQESTIAIWRVGYLFMKNHFWKENTLWSDGYFVSTIGNACEETIKHYIASQG